MVNHHGIWNTFQYVTQTDFFSYSILSILTSHKHKRIREVLTGNEIKHCGLWYYFHGRHKILHLEEHLTVVTVMDY